MLKKALSSQFDSLVNSNIPILLIRVAVGLTLFFNWGLGKLTRVFSGEFQFMDPIGIGATTSLILVSIAEGICSLLVVFGLGTRLASSVLVISFSVVFFIAHAADPFGDKIIQFFFLILFLAIAMIGGGKYSLDEILFNKEA